MPHILSRSDASLGLAFAAGRIWLYCAREEKQPTATILICRKLFAFAQATCDVAEKIAKDLNKRFDLEYEWDGEHIDFERPGVTGRIHVGKERIKLDVQRPPLDRRSSARSSCSSTSCWARASAAAPGWGERRNNRGSPKGSARATRRNGHRLHDLGLRVSIVLQEFLRAAGHGPERRKATLEKILQPGHSRKAGRLPHHRQRRADQRLADIGVERAAPISTISLIWRRRSGKLPACDRPCNSRPRRSARRRGSRASSTRSSSCDKPLNSSPAPRSQSRRSGSTLTIKGTTWAKSDRGG